MAVLVGFIAKQGLKKAIQKYGKTVVTSMIRTSPQVAAQAAKNWVILLQSMYPMVKSVQEK